MSTSTAQDVADFLKSAGVAADFRFCVAVEPPGTEPTLTVYDTPGSDETPEGGLERTALTVRVRHRTYAEAHAAATRAHKALRNASNLAVNQHRYIGFWTASGVGFSHRDSKEQFIVLFSMTTMRYPLPVPTEGVLWAGDVTWAGGIHWAGV